jgi:tetratricopeptide (TPR) repeat protein
MYLNSSFFKLIFVILCILSTVACGGRKGGNTTNQDTAIVTNSVKELSKQIEREPSNAELYYQRSVIYFNESFLDRSLGDIEQAIAYDPQNALYPYFKGRILYSMNQTLKSADAYQQAIMLKPDYEEAKLKLAELYYVVKEHSKSMNLLNTIISVEPSNASAWFFKGMNLREMKDTARAVEAFQQAFDNDNQFYDAVMQLGLIYAARNNKLAVEYYNTAIRIRPKSDEAYFARGVYYQNNKRYKEALADYRKTVTFNSSHDNAYYNVGYINFETGHYKEALKNWNICIQMNNSNVKAYYMRGLVHEMEKDYAEAKLNYEYALQLDPDFELAQAGLKRIK